jgi:hypothetical protein
MDTQPSSNAQGLSNVIDSLLASMAGIEEHTDEYAKMVTQLDKLYKLRQIDIDYDLKCIELRQKNSDSLRDKELKEAELEIKVRELDKPDKLSKDTLAIIGGNLAGILLVIGYERAHVVTTKALSFLMKR